MNLKLTQEQIRARATDQSFSRGQGYYQNEAVFDTTQRGNELHGFCEASSQPNPYHVRIKFDVNGITDATCTCQYEYGGDCKQIVALLLTYLNHLAKFEQLVPVEDTLTERDKNELIALIRKNGLEVPFGLCAT
jgi:uncharacterized Zn finger protein